MGRKPKIPIQEMPMPLEPRPMEPPSMSGGAICAICRKEVDKCCEEMEGSGVVKKVKKLGKKAGKYVTDTDGLLSDIVNYGIPATTSALLGTPAGLVGGPVAGVAASALGSKLGVMASDKIADETMIESRTGEGMKPKRKPRFAKGSQEAKDYMKSLREKRQKK